ncbi:MAG TPA: glycogen/starch/alpha-glucan phosphorylase [Candidatus Methanoperedens sp.]|nr:glycogen/starch/alpha-glucan phosphorylase [Candidatus Methanoperedens sp.]
MTEQPSPFESYDQPGADAESLRRSLVNHLVYTVAKDQYTATDRDLFQSLVLAVRDRLTERWMETMRRYYERDVKRVYYLSMEFLIGRSLTNNLLNTGLMEACRAALDGLSLNYGRLASQEEEAALGNGGLGRLAACILDGMATLDLPGYGYGIRYEYGMFYQKIERGYQVEHLEHWLRYGNPWEFPRPERLYPVRFGGSVVEYRDREGRLRYDWHAADQVMAMGYDTPIPGYATETVNNMRLWSAKATREFDLRYFNEGDYIRAVQDRIHSENLTRVLYPNDSTELGRELRLEQEYFFISASLQDILWRYGKDHPTFDALPDHVAIQLNDTHPALAIPELMRVLLDEHALDWEQAWDLTVRVFGYTNHTLLPEALETWPVHLFQSRLPRHLQIIYEINHRFLANVRHRHPGDIDLARRVSLIQEGPEPRVRMAHLAFVGSHAVNGVSALHTDLMRRTLFADFERFFPERILNVTNGVTPRRWLHEANPGLSALLTSRLGAGWITDLEKLSGLEGHADDPLFREEFQAVKCANKKRLADLIRLHLGIFVNSSTLFDVQIKRIHEYKRQLLNLLGLIARYNRIRSRREAAPVPRTVIFAGKAAPSYVLAKLVIKLIHQVADVVNNDPALEGLLKVVFIPNYDVSTACDIIPAAELSQQISTAGMEASGTGNMKLALNGALTLGTLDGATVEIREAVGEENIFIFGLRAAEILELRRTGSDPCRLSQENAELQQALDMIGAGYFSPQEPDLFRPIVDAVTRCGDAFAVLSDFASYMEAQDRVDALYRRPQDWVRAAILNVTRMGRFSIDRTVREYAEKIWRVRPGCAG